VFYFLLSSRPEPTERFVNAPPAPAGDERDFWQCRGHTEVRERLSESVWVCSVCFEAACRDGDARDSSASRFLASRASPHTEDESTQDSETGERCT